MEVDKFLLDPFGLVEVVRERGGGGGGTADGGFLTADAADAAAAERNPELYLTGADASNPVRRSV